MFLNLGNIEHPTRNAEHRRNVSLYFSDSTHSVAADVSRRKYLAFEGRAARVGFVSPFRAWEFFQDSTRAFSPGFNIAGFQPSRTGKRGARNLFRVFLD